VRFRPSTSKESCGNCGVIELIRGSSFVNSLTGAPLTLTRTTLPLRSTLPRSIAFGESTQCAQIRRRLARGKRCALRRNCFSWIVWFAERRPSSTRSGIRAGFNIGSALDEKLDRRRMRLIGGPHQWSGSAVGLFRVHIRAEIDESLDGVDVARARGG